MRVKYEVTKRLWHAGFPSGPRYVCVFVMSLFQDRVPQGFLYFPEWISATDEDEIIREIDSRQFDQTLSRRVQHYGARYDYRSSSVRESGSAPLIPPTLQKIADRLVSEGLFRTAIDQVIVNEYVRDQGISSHIDSEGFGPVIATVSLLETWPMDFDSAEGDHIQVLLERRSLGLMTGPSRSLWTHGIGKRKTVEVGGLKLRRGRRVSLTFRTLA